MEHLETMAVRITKDNYSTAVACLPGWFSAISYPRAKGRYLVINELQGPRIKDRNKRPFLSNSWMQKEHFHSKYEFVDGEKKNQFRAVRRIN